MLDIKNLQARVAGKEILKGLTLSIQPGEVHAIMGPNGSGKSTLAQVLGGRESFEVTGGSVTYKGKDLLELEVEDRAREGLFLGFQYPVEIPGVSTAYFIKTAVNAVRQHRGEEELDAIDFLNLIEEKVSVVEMDKKMLERPLNEGFSGGEKKRSEILQMLLLQPAMAILDETDSGLDIDALKVVAKGINTLRHPEKSILMITHYQRLLNYVKPDHVHVLYDGRIVKSGGEELARELEKRGYGWVLEETQKAGA